jgi:hypothetical protein
VVQARGPREAGSPEYKGIVRSVGAGVDARPSGSAADSYNSDHPSMCIDRESLWHCRDGSVALILRCHPRDDGLVGDC